MTPSLRSDIINGGYWLRRPEPGAGLAIVTMGAVTPEAIEAAGLLSEDRRGVGVLAVTSADRLSAGWHGAQRARENGKWAARSHVEGLLSALPRDASIITVCDAHPETLSWLGSVLGHRVRPLGVEHFGQSGSISELYGHYGLDANAILAAAEGLGARPVRYRVVG
jgi:pyruvate dehydrogenase E1 component